MHTHRCVVKGIVCFCNLLTACMQLQKQLTVMQHECDRAKSIQKEADKMKTELSTVRGCVLNTV